MTNVEVLVRDIVNSPSGDANWHAIAALTDREDTRRVWQRVVDLAKAGLAPDHYRFSAGCAKYWPAEHRSLVLPLLFDPSEAARRFCWNLLADWPVPKPAVTVDQVVRAIALGSGYHALRLLPAALTWREAQQVRTAVEQSRDRHTRYQAVMWIAEQPHELLYELLAECLGTDDRGIIDQIRETLRSTHCPESVRGACVLIAKDRLLATPATSRHHHSLFEIVLEYASVDGIADLLCARGQWLETTFVAHQFSNLPNKLTRALVQIMPSAPAWWRSSLRARWQAARTREASQPFVEVLERYDRHLNRGPLYLPQLRMSTEVPPWEAETPLAARPRAIDPVTLEPLTTFLGMPLSEPVHTLEDTRFRFDAVLNEATVRGTDLPAREWLRQNGFLQDATEEQLVADERRCDQQEAKWEAAIGAAVVRLRQLHALDQSGVAAAIESARLWVWNATATLIETDEPRAWEPLPLAETESEAAFALQQLALQLREGAAEGYRAARRRLAAVSDDWAVRMNGLPPSEFPLSFPRVRVEGVLGEYAWRSRQIVLYPRMLDWASRDLARTTGVPPDDVLSVLLDLVTAHEGVHAIIHLGLDGDGRSWEGSGGKWKLETYAQFIPQPAQDELNHLQPKLSRLSELMLMIIQTPQTPPADATKK